MSFNFEITDEFSMRTACGLVTDVANNLMEAVVARSETLIPILRNILQAGSVDIDVKLHAIIAIGDIVIASEEG